MPTPPNATATVPVTAVRLDAPLKARIEVARGEIAREMPGLTPTFSDAVRVLLCQALDARAIAASPTDALADAKRNSRAAAAHIDARADDRADAGLDDDDDAYDAAMSVYQAALDAECARTANVVSTPALATHDPASIRAAAADLAARTRAAAAPTGRGAGGITLHRATNGASVATTVANDPK